MSAVAQLRSRVLGLRFGTAVTAARGFQTTSLRLRPQVADGDLISVKDRFSLAGKTYLVTGGGRGIGYAGARAIAEYGGNVAILDIAPKPVADFGNLERDFGTKTKYLRADVADEASLTSAFEEAVTEFGTLDGLVTAAGIGPEEAFVKHTWAETKRCLDVNVTGTFFAAQLATKHMQAHGKGGSIVMIASISSQMAVPGVRLSAYSASKGAVKMLATALSVELGPHNIRVNTISPGYTETELLTPLKALHPKLVEMMRREPPLKRIGNRNDLAPAIVYLLSDASSYTTGADLVVAGGLTGGRIESPYL